MRSLTEMCPAIGLLLLSFLQCSFGQSRIVVSLPKVGSLVGSTTKTAWSGKDIYQFLGVPFAEPPSKNLRFKPPVPRSKWFGIRDATKFGNQCPSMQNMQTLNNSEGDVEDCLNLCVYTKNLKAKSTVMVYIHGGIFIVGSAAEYHPNYLLEEDIVLVVPQYRLGALGFLSTGTAGIPGNMGLLDIKLALEWVQQHIWRFGGDPNRVTLFGQSAGAAIISGLMISPAISTNLFKRTILQSGAVTGGWATKSDSVQEAQTLADKLNCDNCESVEAINKCLINAPVIKILEASISEVDLAPFSLTTGDYNNIFPSEPDLLAQSGTNYPMIAGVTKHEGTLSLSLVYDFFKKAYGNTTIPPRKFIELVISALKEKGNVVNMATKLFFKSEDLDGTDYTPLIPGLINLAGTITIKSPVIRFAQLNARNNPNPNFVYTLDYKGEYTRFGSGGDTDHYPFYGGVHHSDDNIYLFATNKLNEQDTVVAKTMVELWTSFAIKGKPEAQSVQIWNPMTSLSGPYLHINEICSLGMDFLDEFLVAGNEMIRGSWNW